MLKIKNLQKFKHEKIIISTVTMRVVCLFVCFRFISWGDCRHNVCCGGGACRSGGCGFLRL